MTFTPSEVRAYYAYRMPTLKQSNAKEWRDRCPVHSGKDLNFAVSSETGLAQCWSQCGRGWDILALEQELTGVGFQRAKERAFELVGRPKIPWEDRDIEAVYDYTDEQGKLLYQVLRKVGKQFTQRRPNGASGGWLPNLGNNTRRVPFRLPKVLNAEFVIVVEGEKDVLTLERIGLVGTCNNGGAGNFTEEQAKCLSGKHVAIIADNDKPGRGHALKLAPVLAPLVKSLKIIELPGLSDKGDVTDYVKAGGTVDKIRELYRKAQLWTPEWEFTLHLPNENDKHWRTFPEDVTEAGGLEKFWDLTKLSGLETPWVKLSRALGGGMRRGEVYIIGADTGVGKTSLALQFGIAVMRQRKCVLLFSMEMGWRAIFQRMCSIEARVDLKELRNAQITLLRRDAAPEDRFAAQDMANALSKRLAAPTAEFMDLPLLVSTKARVTPEYISGETARMKERGPVELVIVDHMQLMGSTGSVRGDYEKFTEISRTMKLVAAETDVPVLVLSQTNRAQRRDRRTEPEISDLRGSGALEEDAAAVMLLYEDADDAETALAEGDGERYVNGPVKTFLKLAKNRYGDRGRYFMLQHTKTCTRFDQHEESQLSFGAKAGI